MANRAAHRSRFRPIWILGLCCVATLGAHPEDDAYDTTIESVGRATIEDDFHHIAFTLTRAYAAPTAAAAVEQALSFEKLVRDAVNAAVEADDLPHADVDAHPPGLPQGPWPASESGPSDADPPADPERRVEAKVTLAFTTLGFAVDVDPLIQLARIADAAAAIARQCEAEANGPVLAARDAARTEHRAIIRAVENAYLPADAAAEALESRIIAVKHAVVESVRWETAAPTVAGRAQTRPLACHARVRVTYVLGPR